MHERLFSLAPRTFTFARSCTYEYGSTRIAYSYINTRFCVFKHKSESGGGHVAGERTCWFQGKRHVGGEGVVHSCMECVDIFAGRPCAFGAKGMWQVDVEEV